MRHPNPEQLQQYTSYHGLRASTRHENGCADDRVPVNPSLEPVVFDPSPTTIPLLSNRSVGLFSNALVNPDVVALMGSLDVVLGEIDR